ncbi:TolC family protein [Aliarcobacter cryaerophilus]|uniref:Transporter n=1 Tax=Aliarcobacter cryaerophilus TaxID=28198 RepID=A0A2S9TP04_9BACT|nr:TolC family protein [Aliarcobacter cryaerophilus]PRN00561.1 transporter [Arcobacter cryaerophilus gv. pseudocryaerophilus]
MKKYNILISTIVSSFLLVGCSVKPKPFLPEYIKQDVENNLEQLNKLSQPITKPISLDEAINRAIENNLSKKLDLLSSALEEQKIDIVAFEALPSLTAKAGYSERNNYAASSSVPFSNGKPGNPTNSYSVSQEKESTTAGVGFSWNMLDFGLSYVRANQQADRFLIAKEKELKSIHNIKEEVRNAYYQAVSADELLKSIKPIMSEVELAFSDSEKITKLNIDSPIKSLTYQRELLEVIRSLNTLEENLLKSKIELAKLMGLKPGTSFELAEKIKDKYDLPIVEIPIEDLEKYALENRSELQEIRYQERISQAEVKAIMLKMLPGIDLNAGYSVDNNNYLLNKDWVSYGANISWNLMNVFNSSLNQKLAKTQIELAKQQKLALSMAIISQVHISILDFEQSKKDYKLSEKYFRVAKEIYKIIENENALDINGNLSLIKEKLNYLISNLRLSSSYAKVQNSYGKIISSVGNEEYFKNQIQEKDYLIDSNTLETTSNEQVVNEKIEDTLEEDKQSENSYKIEKIGYVSTELDLMSETNINSTSNRKIKKNQKVIIVKGDFINQDWTRFINSQNEVLILQEDNNPLWYRTKNGYIMSKYLKIENNN